MGDDRAAGLRWIVVAVLGALLLAAAAGLAFGAPAGMAVAGLLLIVAAIDGRN